MKLTKEELKNMSFSDAFTLEETDDYGAEECCIVCGSNLEDLKIGFNEEEQLYKYECANCEAVFVVLKNSAGDESVILQGEERNWPEYLMEVLKFPFDAEIIESDDREFFDPEYDGPGRYDDVKVLDVFYSMKYGVEARIRKGRRTYRYILCFMEAFDSDSSNYRELENYKRWREKYWQSDYLLALFGAMGKAGKEQGE